MTTLELSEEDGDRLAGALLAAARGEALTEDEIEAVGQLARVFRADDVTLRVKKEN